MLKTTSSLNNNRQEKPMSLLSFQRRIVKSFPLLFVLFVCFSAPAYYGKLLSQYGTLLYDYDKDRDDDYHDNNNSRQQQEVVVIETTKVSASRTSTQNSVSSVTVVHNNNNNTTSAKKLDSQNSVKRSVVRTTQQKAIYDHVLQQTTTANKKTFTIQKDDKTRTTVVVGNSTNVRTTNNNNGTTSTAMLNDNDNTNVTSATNKPDDNNSNSSSNSNNDEDKQSSQVETQNASTTSQQKGTTSNHVLQQSTATTPKVFPKRKGVYPSNMKRYRLLHPTNISKVEPLYTSHCQPTLWQEQQLGGRLAVLVVTANRAHYLTKMIDSLLKQSVHTFDVFIFIDNLQVQGQNIIANQQVIHLAKKTSQSWDVSTGSNFTYRVASEPTRGVARMTLWAIQTALDEYNYNRFLLLEDDHLIGHTYIEGIHHMLNAAEHLPQVALVNGNFIDTPQDGETKHMPARDKIVMEREDDCEFQMALHVANIDIHAHNVWAWATTRKKWKQIEPSYLRNFYQGHLHNKTYDKRPGEKIREMVQNMCPGTGLDRWFGGQDWLRACTWHFNGLIYKLQPTKRLMSYIGSDGTNMNKKEFDKLGFKPQAADHPSVKRNVSNYMQDLCTKTCILDTINKDKIKTLTEQQSSTTTATKENKPTTEGKKKYPTDMKRYRLLHPRNISRVEPLYTNHCQDILQREQQRGGRLAVLMVTANRANYLTKIIDSLRMQSVNTFDVFIFIDNLLQEKEEHRQANQQVIDLAQKTYDSWNVTGSNFTYRVASEPTRGVARMTLWAIQTALDEYNYNRFLLLEDDHLIGHTYIEGIHHMLNAAEHLPQVAVVNGNFIDTPQDEETKHFPARDKIIMEREDDCEFQMALHVANIDINAHNVWAWATTRKKWKQIEPSYLRNFHEGHLHNETYDKRSGEKIREMVQRMCPGTGLNRWFGGQDWLRACTWHSNGLIYKLQPTKRLMSYIGSDGTNMNKKEFDKLGFNPQAANHPSVKRNVSNYMQDLCTKTCILDKINKLK